MSDFKEIQPEGFEQSPFKMIGKDWMLVTAEKEGKVNTMTASWGGMGIMWGKNVVYVVLRPQRYTKEFVDYGDTFSLSFFDGQYKKQLGYLGSVSGRDEDKIQKSELTVLQPGDTPYFAEASTVILCKKLFAQELRPESFIATELDEKWYPGKDYHTLYIAEVERILVK